MIRPLSRIAITFGLSVVGGLRAADFVSDPLLLLLGAAAAGAFLTGLRPRALGALIGIAGAGLGAITADSVRGDCLFRLPDGARVQVLGTLAAHPDPSGAAEVRAAALVVAGSSRRCGSRILVRADEGAWVGAGGGARIRVAGRWLAFPPDGGSLRRPRWAGTLVADSVVVLRPPSVRSEPAATLRGRAQERIGRLFPDHAGLVEALILAQRGGIDPAIRDRFARAGLAHLLAISGLHVGIIAGVLLLIGRVMRLGARWTAIAAFACTVGYVLFIGAPHPAMRAALQLGLITASRRLQRPSDRYTPLAAIAIFLVALDPLAILEPGFQLSFAGVAGLIALRRRFLTALSFFRVRYLQDSLATSIAATIATAPITALHFGSIAPIGIVSNVVAIPVVGAAVPAVAAALAVGAVHEGAGRFLADGAALLLDVLGWTAAWAAELPGASVWVPRDAVAAWALAAAAAYVVAATLRRSATGKSAARIRPVVRRGVAIGTAMALLVAWPALVRRGGALEIHAIDVGQGDAYAIRTPSGRWILVDAGPRTERFDAGRARVVPFLLAHGVRRLEALVLTHPDADHIGGAPAVLEAFDVGAVVDPGLAAGKDLYVSLLERARRRDIQWIVARRGQVVQIGEVALHFLYPDSASLDGTVEANQVSVAFRLEYRSFRGLFLGDLPAEVERELARADAEGLRAEFLKVAHHGSRTSTSDALLAAAAPSVAVISVGRHNRYGHPDPVVLDRLRRRDVRILRTDRDGSVRVRVLAGGRMEVSTAR